jgi:hypothetical protein
MPNLFKHREHLFRMAVLFAGGTLLFVILRAVLVPSDFGVYGHFRAGALDDVKAHPIKYAGQATCVECHTDIAETRAGGKHARIGCEACHGALAIHAEGKSEEKPVRPDPRTTCLRCHTKNVAKPKGFPQIVPAEHSEDGPCTACHQPHSPGLS